MAKGVKSLEVDLRDGSGRVIKFTAPLNATPTQIGILAQRAIKQNFPGEQFKRPKLDRPVYAQSKVFDASVSATPDSLRSRAGNKARDIATGVGFSRQTANNIASRTESAIDFVPLAGDAVGADDAATAFKAGRYGEAALGAGATAIGLIPGFGDAAAPAMKAMFLGARAKNADHAMLAKAQDMLKAGDSKNTIWNETGWFTGADGKWRFEVPDDDLKIDVDRARAELPNPNDEYDASLERTRGRSDEDRVNFAVRAMKRAQEKTLLAPDVVRHTALSDAYPNVNGIGIGREWNRGLNGSWNSSTGTLSLNLRNEPEEIRSTAGHELQHFVQDQEGFARGGMPQGFTQQKEAQMARDALAWRKELAKKRAEMPNADPIAIENALVNDYQQIDAMDWVPSREARDVATNFSENPDEQLAKVVEAYGLHKRVTPYSPHEAYTRLAGEVEARNVQTRLNMDPEMRRATPPWATQEFPDDEQFKIWGGDGAANLGEPSSLSTPRVPTPEEMQRLAQRQNVSLDAARHGNRLDWGRNKRGDYGEPLVAGYADRPVAVQMENGEFVLLDGNHRAAMARQLGVSEMEMDVIPARAYDPENMGMKPAPSKWTDDDLDAMMKELGTGDDDIQASAEAPLAATWGEEEFEPIRAYHGTRSEFDEFGRIDGGNANGQGYYFTTDPEEASRYATGDDVNRITMEGNAGPNVRPVALNVRNPFDGTAAADRDLMKRLADAHNEVAPGTWGEDEIFEHFDRPAKARDVLQTLTYNADRQNDILRAAGFDARLGGYGPNDIMVFDPKQIRSVFDPLARKWGK